MNLQEMWAKYVPHVGCEPIIYKNTTLLTHHMPLMNYIENLEVRNDDIWLCGFPKTGTTWCQEMVWNIANDLNFETAKVDMYTRVPYLEYLPGVLTTDRSLSPFVEIVNSKTFNSIETIKNLPNPRFIKTHLPFHLLPRQLRTNSKAKIVYIWRNPKDVCISAYHFYKLLNLSTDNFADFCKLFLNDAVMFAPYWIHVLGFWNMRNEENVLFLKYEDMKADLPSVIRKTANFLGKNLDDERIAKLQNHLSFSSMSVNPAVNHEDSENSSGWSKDGKFMRKGEADQWKTEMSNEMIKQFDTWTRENLKNNESLLRELSELEI